MESVGVSGSETLALSVPVDFETLAGDGAAMQSFKTSIRRVLAAVMGIDVARVVVTSVYAGSTRVEFTVAGPTGPGGAKSSAEAISVLILLMQRPAGVVEAEFNQRASQLGITIDFTGLSLDVVSPPAPAPASTAPDGDQPPWLLIIAPVAVSAGRAPCASLIGVIGAQLIRGRCCAARCCCWSTLRGGEPEAGTPTIVHSCLSTHTHTHRRTCLRAHRVGSISARCADLRQSSSVGRR